MADLNIGPGSITPSVAGKLRQDSSQLARLKNDFERQAQSTAPDFIAAELTARDSSTGRYAWNERSPTTDPTAPRYDTPNGLFGTAAWNPALVMNGETITCSTSSPFQCYLKRLGETTTYGTLWEIIGSQSSDGLEFIETDSATTTYNNTVLIQTDTIGSFSSLTDGEYILLGAFVLTQSSGDAADIWVRCVAGAGVSFSLGDYYDTGLRRSVTVSSRVVVANGGTPTSFTVTARLQSYLFNLNGGGTSGLNLYRL